MPAQPEIGRFIRTRREALGMTQVDLHIATGITQSEISRIEKGIRLDPSLDSLREIGKALNVSLLQLLRVAGYLDDGTPADVSPWEALFNAVAALGDLTPPEITDIVEYARFRIRRHRDMVTSE